MKLGALTNTGTELPDIRQAIHCRLGSAVLSQKIGTVKGAVYGDVVY